MKARTIIIGMGCALLFLIFQPIAFAQRGNEKQEQRFVICKEGSDKPDLTVTTAVIQKSDEIIVSVKNLGPCDAPAATLKMDWAMTEAEIKEKASLTQPTDKHWLWFAVPAIKRGASIQLKQILNNIYGKFSADKNIFAFTVDYQKQIKEKDEYNNTFILKP